MDTAELTALLDRLRAEPRGSEWLEFKAARLNSLRLWLVLGLPARETEV